MGIVLPIGLFILLPTLIAGLLPASSSSSILRNLLEGLVRIVIFLGVHYHHIQTERCAAHLYVPRRRTQDHCLL